MAGRSRTRPTMVDVAESAGVSLKTVSRVVNGVSTVDQDLAERVRQAAVQLGFRPNRMAADLKSGAATAMIGLVTKDISNEFYAAITQGTAEVAAQRGVQLITAGTSGEDIEEETEISTIFELCRRRVDGLIIVPRGKDQSVLAREMEMGTPMVFVDQAPHGMAADSIVLDNERGTALAIDDLIERGHRRIGLVCDSLDIDSIHQRYLGHREQLRHYDLPVEDELFYTGVHGPDETAKAVGALLDGPRPPTAIFCGNNRATIGTVREVWRRRADVTIAGFDDFTISDLMPVPLTLVSFDATELGRRAAQMLFDRIDGDDGPAKSITLPVRLRQSGIPSSRRV